MLFGTVFFLFQDEWSIPPTASISPTMLVTSLGTLQIFKILKITSSKVTSTVQVCVLLNQCKFSSL